MGLTHLGHIDLPEHVGEGGFDHAAVDRRRGTIYVAHTANDALDLIDLRSDRYVRSIGALKGVAGALVHEPTNLVFSSNRRENSVAMITSSSDEPTKVAVGIRPNGLAYDPSRGVLLSANVGDPTKPGSASVSLVDIRSHSALTTLPMPGRTRWTVFDPDQDLFFVNIAEPAAIVVIEPKHPLGIARRMNVPARSPHGLDLDSRRQRLYCACDEGKLISVDALSGAILGSLELSGAPDVVFLNSALDHLYVAIGDPGMIDVIDVGEWRRIETTATEPGAHTLAFNAGTNRVYAFLPGTHRASVYQDEQ